MMKGQNFVLIQEAGLRIHILRVSWSAYMWNTWAESRRIAVAAHT